MSQNQPKTQIKIIRTSSEDTAKSSANYISKESNSYLTDSIPVLFLVSGGSSLKVLEDMKIDNNLLSKGLLTAAVVDERYTTKSKYNNYEQFLNTDFYKKHSKHLKSISTKVKTNQTHQKHAEKYEEELRNWKKSNPNGKIIGLFGIGEDCHTAGIIPDSDERLYKSDNWIVAYDIGRYENDHKKRTTTTIHFIINIVDSYYIFAVGDEKKDVISTILNEPVDIKSKPASVFKDIALNSDKNVIIFTDQAI